VAEAAEAIRPAAETPRPRARTSRTPARLDEKVPRAVVNVAPAPAAPAERPPDLLTPWLDLAAYQRDLWERSILFVDTLRQRADDLLAHQRAGKPPLLDFDYELILDARRFEKPANYALLRITRVADACLDDCLDSSKPPVMVLDPRAGHGPGIGGFKRESEVGLALRHGHPVYFVMFYPEPCPGQTLADVHHALRRFVKEVAHRHPGLLPILYGNCQAGWAVTLLASDCEGLAGPIVLNGSPLSYWAGDSGVNPMRICGGLFGGAWPAHLAADLADGRFDGAWLVQNFESLKPEAVWEKYANLFSHVDSECERFLAFERWWGSFYFLSREEILSIIENLFVGNRLEEGTLRICEHCFADLRRIHNPIVIFASYGDDITPPHQALGWIPAVYKDTDDLKRAGQRIVYLIDPHVGHLGIFVSASVARFEHRAILDSLPDIAALPPGLYEMKIDNPTGDPDCHKSAYTVRFEERQVENLRFPVDRPAFARVRTVSEQLDAMYTATLSIWVQALTTPVMAAVLEWLHPMRISRFMFASSFHPAMRAVAGAAKAIREDRHAVPETAPLKMFEQAAFDGVRDALNQYRTGRDKALEQMFDWLYGSGEERKDPTGVQRSSTLAPSPWW
jgi:Protein of unknown function (DUF3141)